MAQGGQASWSIFGNAYFFAHMLLSCPGTKLLKNPDPVHVSPVKAREWPVLCQEEGARAEKLGDAPILPALREPSLRQSPTPLPTAPSALSSLQEGRSLGWELRPAGALRPDRVLAPRTLSRRPISWPSRCPSRMPHRAPSSRADWP